MPGYQHKTGDGALRRLWKAEEELEAIYAHLRAVVGNTDPGWTGWRHAIEMLIPDSGPRIEELLRSRRSARIRPGPALNTTDKRELWALYLIPIAVVSFGLGWLVGQL